MSAARRRESASASAARPRKLRALDVQQRFLKCLKNDRRYGDLAKYLRGEQHRHPLEHLTACINHLIENPGFGEWRINHENRMQERRDKLRAAEMVIEEIFAEAARMWFHDHSMRPFADIALYRIDTKRAVIAGLGVMDEILRKWCGPQALPSRSARTRPYHAMAMFLCAGAQEVLFHLDIKKGVERQANETAPLERERDELRRSQPGSEELKKLEQSINTLRDVPPPPSVILPMSTFREPPRQLFDAVTYRFVRELLVYILPGEKIPAPESLRHALTGSRRPPLAR